MQRCLLPSCAGCKLVRCGNCAGCLRKKGGCNKKAYAGDCQNAPKPAAPRRAPTARRAPAAKAAPAKTRSKWSEEEQNKAEELYAEGTRDRAQFGTDLSAALKGSKSPVQCAAKYSDLKRVEPKHFFVFDFNKENPTQHTAELIAALPVADRTLKEPEIKRRWEKVVEGKGAAGATKLLSNALDHAFNFYGGEPPKNAQECVQVLARSGLPPSFLELNPPKRNPPGFRKAVEQFHLLTNSVKLHREAALAQFMGSPTKCCWGFLLPDQGRSDNALQKEMAARAVFHLCVAYGAHPATQLPTSKEMPLIKRLTIKPPFEPVAPGATHATDPSYARRYPA